MPADEENDQNDNDSGGEGAPDPLAELAAHTQKIGKAQHTRGINKGIKDTLAALGFEGVKVEEAKATLDALRSRDGDVSELQGKYETTVSELAEVRSQLSTTGLHGETLVGLMKEGIRGDRVEPALKLVMSELAALPSAPTAEAITSTVQEFKANMPELFEAAASEGDQGQNGNGAGGLPPSIIPKIEGTGTGPAGGRGGSDDAVQRGRAMVDRLGLAQPKPAAT